MLTDKGEHQINQGCRNFLNRVRSYSYDFYRKLSKPRSYSVNTDEPHSDSETVDDLQTVKKRLLTPAIPNRALAARKRSKSADALSLLTASDSDNDEDVFGDELDSVVPKVSKSSKTPTLSKLARQQEIIMAEAFIEIGMNHSNNHAVNGMNGTVDVNDKSNSDGDIVNMLNGVGDNGPAEVSQTNGHTDSVPVPVRKKGVLRKNDDTKPLPEFEQNESTVTNQNIVDNAQTENNPIEFHLATEGGVKAEERSDLPFSGKF